MALLGKTFGLLGIWPFLRSKIFLLLFYGTLRKTKNRNFNKIAENPIFGHRILAQNENCPYFFISRQFITLAV